MKKQHLILLILSLCFLTGYSQSQQQKTNESALRYMDSRIQQNPANAELFLQRAMAHLYTGQYARAVHDFDSLMPLMKTGDPEMYYFRGIAKEGNKQFQLAWNDFDEAILLSATKPNAFYLMGRGYASYKLGQYPQAVKDFAKANTLSPENGEIEQFLKIAKAKIEKITIDTSVIALDSTNQRYEITDNILLFFDQQIKQNPSDTDIYAKRAMAYFFIGRYEDAIKDFDKAIKVNIDKSPPQSGTRNPIKLKLNNVDSYYFRAVARESDGLFKQSLIDFDRAIQLSAAKPNYFHFMLRGYARYNLSMYKEAVEDLEKADALSPENEEIKALLDKAMAKKIGGGDVMNVAVIKELQGYINEHKFQNLEEGRTYYNTIKEKDLSIVGFEQVAATFRKKLLKDIYGESPTVEQLDQIRDVLQVEKWLSPEGMEQYFHYFAESANHFTGKVDLPNYTYYFTVIKDTKGNKYDLNVQQMEHHHEDIEFAYTTTLFANEIETKDGVNVRVHYSYNVGGLRWKFSPPDYLEVVYSKNSDLIQEKASGAMGKYAVEKPITAKTTLLKKDTTKEFSEKEAIRKAVQIMLIAYTKVITDQQKN